MLAGNLRQRVLIDRRGIQRRLPAPSRVSADKTPSGRAVWNYADYVGVADWGAGGLNRREPLMVRDPFNEQSR